jgi:hypothetical protein
LPFADFEVPGPIRDDLLRLKGEELLDKISSHEFYSSEVTVDDKDKEKKVKRRRIVVVNGIPGTVREIRDWYFITAGDADEELLSGRMTEGIPIAMITINI